MIKKAKKKSECKFRTYKPDAVLILFKKKNKRK